MDDLKNKSREELEARQHEIQQFIAGMDLTDHASAPILAELGAEMRQVNDELFRIYYGQRIETVKGVVPK